MKSYFPISILFIQKNTINRNDREKLKIFNDLIDIQLEESFANCCFDLLVNEYLFHDSSTKKIPSIAVLDQFVAVVQNSLLENNLLK